MKHSGGKCPVPAGTLVDVKFRDGTVRRAIPALMFSEKYDPPNLPYEATSAHWDRDDLPNDIVEYQISKPE